MEQIKFFYCYDTQLNKTIQKNSINYICRGIHPVSKKLFRQYILTDRLEKIIDEYNQYKMKSENP